MRHFLKRLCQKKQGATTVEYGLLIGLISIAILLSVSSTGTSIRALMMTVANTLQNVSNATEEDAAATPPVSNIVSDANGRHWSDGTYAASCNDYLNPVSGYSYTGDTTSTGLYRISPETTPFDAYCDMTTDGGGWTAFFVGINGSTHVFAHFEDTADTCTTPASTCLRHIPSTISSSNTFAAQCGSAMVRFNITPALASLFKNSTRTNGWTALTNVVAIAGSVGVTPTIMFGGAGANKSFILGTSATSALSVTFAQSYDYNAAWNYCNGVADTSSVVRLYYR